MTVAVSGSVYTSGFMMDSSTVRRALSGSAPAASPGLSFTKSSTSTKTAAHIAAATPKAALIPVMPASAALMDPTLVEDTAEDTDTSTAVPSEPATMRRVLLTEVPWLMSLLSSAFMPQVVVGMFTRAMEPMRMV